MQKLQQRLMEQATAEIVAKEQELQESNDELALLVAKLKVESTALRMQDLSEHLKEDFKYSAQALEGMLMQENERNAELKKDLEVLNFRKSVIASQFSGDELG